MAYDDDEYFLPLEDQRVFGAGITRKRVPFVPSSQTTAVNTICSPSRGLPSSTSSTLSAQTNASSIADKYLSIVLSSAPHTDKSERDQASSTEISTSTITPLTCAPSPPRPLHLPPPATRQNTPRTPTKPPSPIKFASRTPTLRLLSTALGPASSIFTHGAGIQIRAWAFGSHGQGISVPLKPRVKHDTLGLGVKPPKREKESAVKAKKKVEKLNAKQVRKLEDDRKKKGESLGEMFYAREDVEKYLGACSYM
ncbi:hypothetical protein AJ78_00645 [Emergomyces pasteurianus Ep9510]|uniref:Uncharacterized protein n=1 Tax=Emergomyces pasteurianus Ep9510 TaxID=1447872 RepID=A0A1J9QT52_9EURO|nr:hypothetical protein AJ78_00645 [Emergomyces pasteurianus Ep9510]